MYGVPKPCPVRGFVLSGGLGEHGIEDFGDDALADLGECADAFELLLNFRGWAAFAGGFGGGAADQVFDGGVERLGREGERGDAHAAAFVVGHGLLGDAEDSGEFDLGDVACLAAFGEALAELFVERAIGDGHGGIGR